MPRKTGRGEVATLVFVTAVLSGCHGPLNQPISPGPEPLPIYAEDHGQSDLSANPVRSLTNEHNRSHWQAITIEVPVNQVEHEPTYTWSAYLQKDTRRQRGDYPTAESSLDIDLLDGGGCFEGAADIVLGFGAIARAPFQMIQQQCPWTVVRSPRGPYERLVERVAADLDRWFVETSEEN